MTQAVQRAGLWFSVERSIVVAPELITAVDSTYRSSHSIEEMLGWSASDIEWDPLVQWLHQEINLNRGSPDESVLALQFACTDRLHGFWRYSERPSQLVDTSFFTSFAAVIRARLTMADSLRAFDESSWLNPNWIELTNALFSCQINPRLALRPLSEWPTTSVMNAAEQFVSELKGNPLKNILQELSVLAEIQKLDFLGSNGKQTAAQMVLVWLLEKPTEVKSAWDLLSQSHQQRLGGERFLSAFTTIWAAGVARFHRWLDCSALMVGLHERADRQ